MSHSITRLSRPIGLAGLLAVVVVLLLSPTGQWVESHAIQPPAAPVALPFTITLQPVITGGLSSPVHIANAGDGRGRLFVVEQGGRIRVIKNGELLAASYLDIHAQVSCCVERGLLSVAFDPAFETNGTFYVNYTNLNGDTNVERFVVSNPAADVANVIAATKIMTIDQPEANHNGGQLQFGPNDGYLYIGMGDGGGGGDNHGPIGNGQNPATLLGKMLRIHVRGVPTYTIPASNPFTQTAGYLPEIWALGLRNPWRFSFDRTTGDLFIGDVGQDCWEEIDYQAASSHGGENYGWRIMEGFRPFNFSNFNDCLQNPIEPPTLTKPIAAYDHNFGSAVAGGYVYRGQAYPWLRGIYFYGDPYSGRIWSLERISVTAWLNTLMGQFPVGMTSFGEDESGELYVTDYGGGRIHRLLSASPINFSASTKQVSSAVAHPGSALTYTIILRNSGSPFANTLRVTDVVPAGLNYLPGSFTATTGSVDDSSAPTLTWSGAMSNMPGITLTYAVTVSALNSVAIINHAIINPGADSSFTRSATVIVNATQTYLSLILKNF